MSPRNQSGGIIFDRPVSSSRQEFGTNRKNWPLSEPVVKIEALAQTSGQAKYIWDMPDQPTQLFAAFVTAEAVPGSAIQSIDPSDALVSFLYTDLTINRRHVFGKTNNFLIKA